MEALSQRESEARDRVFGDALSKSGEAAEEHVAQWIAARRDYAKALRALATEDAQKVLAEELSRIETQIARLEESGRMEVAESFRLCVELGLRSRWVLWLADLLNGEMTMDPLSLVAQEIARIDQQGKNLARLDSRLQEQTLEVVRSSRKAQLRLLRSRLRRFVDGRAVDMAKGPLDNTTVCWVAVSEAYRIEIDAFREIAHPRSFFTLAGEAGIDELRERREELLDRCRAELAACTAEEASEFIRSSLADLLDDASGLMSEGESLASDVRMRIFGLVDERLGKFLQVLGDWKVELGKRDVLEPEDRRRFRLGIRQLHRARRGIYNAGKESRVQGRLERLFGPANVKFFEAFIFVLIFALLGLVFFEWRLPRDLPNWLYGEGELSLSQSIFSSLLVAQTLKYFAYVDLLFCLVFQLDFFVRWAFAGWGLSYFRRHFFFESLPAFPYSLILGGGDGAHFIILMRILRFRGALAIRAMVLVFLRLFRVAVFFMRGVDRAVEKFRPFLDRDVVFFETDPLGESQESPLWRRATALESQRQRFERAFYDGLRWEERAQFLSSHGSVLGSEASVTSSLPLAYRRGVSLAEGEIHIEQVIHSFLDCNVTRAMGMLGRDGVQRVSRWIRFVDVPGFRSAPIIRRIVPAARMLNPAEAVSFAANAVGQVLQEFLGVVRFWADMSGITTGPQILDRIGTAIVTASKRPAVRLVLFGSIFLILEAILTILGWEQGVLAVVSKKIVSLLGYPIMILGSVCFVVLMLGLWFKRISGEALDHYLRTADAQFYPLIKARKFLQFDEDIETLYRSVLRPESRLRDRESIERQEWVEFLGEPIRERALFMPGRLQISDDRFQSFADDREMIVLLYRDFLDSPVLHRSDDKSSIQLLGNISLQSIRFRTLGHGVKDIRRLEKLALERGSVISFGPYFWFRFITESLAIETAKLILEYNSTCIPLDQVHLARPEARKRYEEFLAEHRSDHRKRRTREATVQAREVYGELSNANFTAFDFLGPSEQSDAVVRKRYGDEVLQALIHDRRAVVRDIFGTRSYHLLPKAKRVFNPYRLYRKYLAGAKFFFLPFVFTFAILRLNVAAFSHVRELIDEVRGRKKKRRSQLSRFASFEVAVRKINRMRKPLFMEALRLRAKIDVEYLGLRIPGQERDPETVSYEEHLDFIGAIDAERRPLEKLRDRAVKDMRRLRIFLAENGMRHEGLLEFLRKIDPSGQLARNKDEVLRALVTAYVTDHDGLRSMLTAPQWSRRFFEKVLRREKRTLMEYCSEFFTCTMSVFLPRHRRRRKLLREFIRLDPALRGLDGKVRRRVLARFLEATSYTEQMLDYALRHLRGEREVGRDMIREALERAACDYKLWTRKLVTVRTIQTLTVLSVRNYRKLVQDVGGYADEENGE